MASVQQHKSKYRVKWRVDGRAVYESFATEREAKDFARKVEAKTLLDGEPPATVDPNTLTLARWWSRWEPGRPWRPSTRRQHDMHWRLYVGPVFGRVPIENIGTADIQKFHRRLEARGLAPGTVGQIHRTLSMVLEGAVADGLLSRNPAKFARLRRVPKHPPVALDAKTTQAMLDAIEATTPELNVYARLVAVTGLRRAEAAGLTWDRIDLAAGVLVVDRQLDGGATAQPAWSPTKTNQVRRVLLTDSLVALLRAHRKAQPVAVLDGTGLVFCRDDGSPWTMVSLNRAWRRAAKLLDEAGAPLPSAARGWHCLRHGVASRLLEAGVPPVEAAQMLGHSPEMLLSVYGHVVDRSAADERLRAALDA